MTRPPTVRYPELPIDVVDATGLLGALVGLLSTVLPFFLGLVLALEAILLVAGLLRTTADGAAQRSTRRSRHRYWLGFATAGIAWILVLAHPGAADRFAGAALGAGGLPLWSIARRPLPFGGC